MSGASASGSEALEDPTTHGALRVVAIGGGTGLSTLLARTAAPRRLSRLARSRFPRHISDLAAVVTVTDDGGSSGRLRKDFNMLPPGDLRNCMVALSAEEDLLSSSSPTASAPATGSKATTSATSSSPHSLRSPATSPTPSSWPPKSSPPAAASTPPPPPTPPSSRAWTTAPSSAAKPTSPPAAAHRRAHARPARRRRLPETLEAIERADLITVGPGSLYTSLITNLLVQGIPSALADAPGHPRLHLQPDDPGQ